MSGADEETTDNSLIDEEEDEFEVDPETGEVLDYGHRTVRARGGTVDDGGAAAMKGGSHSLFSSLQVLLITAPFSYVYRGS